MSFFNIISPASGNRKYLPVTTPTNPELSGTISILNIGDSISRGTSNGTTDATDGTLEEWNATSMVAITTDVINANTGSPYPSMAAKLVELGADKLQVVNTGNSGARVIYSHNDNHWGTTGNLYVPMVTKANNYLTNQGLTKFDFIRITLGINDIFLSQNNTVEDIINGYLDLISRLKTDFPNTRILVNNIGYDTDDYLTANHGILRKFIQDLAEGDSLVYAGKDLLDFPYENFYDGIHIDQPSNNEFGEFDALQMVEIMSIPKPRVILKSPEIGQNFYLDQEITINTIIQE